MPIPKHTESLASSQLAPAVDCTGVTELRVHGVGGTPPDAILGDLAPEQVWGDRIAGFYRTSDHQASPDDDVKRHVECYSWSGLTSRSKSRVLWLALLPFMLGNLAGWMCSAKTRSSDWRFALHRAAAGLGTLALTINAVLVAVLITVDILGYQTVRTGLAAHQWWLGPLTWPTITGHPARQLLVALIAPVLFVLALWLLAFRSWRYEAVRPPYECKKDQPHDKPRPTATAASLKNGLADKDFWDGGTSVRLLTWLHIATSVGFLAIVLSVTAWSVGGGSSQAIVWWWVAICAGGAAVMLAVAYICLEACGALTDTLQRWSVALLIPAAAGLVCAGVFAWLQPAGSPGEAAALPGMAGIVGWTTLAIAVPVAALLISAVLGIGKKGRHALPGGPWVTLVLAFSLLNVIMLGVLIWVAHLVGPVTTSASYAVSHKTIYIPYVITSGVPIVVFAAVVVAIVFAAAEFIRWRLARRLPDEVVEAYQERTDTLRRSKPEQLKPWYYSGTSPFSPAGEDQDPHWTGKIARARMLGGVPQDAGWLLWGIILLQLTAALWTWQLHKEPPLFISNAGILIAGLLLPTLMGFLYKAWSDPVRGRQIAVLWDVGTFWPRSYHPLSPPCYAERAVPDLQRRLWWLHDNDDCGRVVLVGHSQGTMLAIAALVQKERRPAGGGHASLITFGSPAGKLYAWAFPAYIAPELLTPLAPGGGGDVREWLNFYYPTDPIGGPVFAETTSSARDLVDRPLPDPAESWYVYGQPLPAPQRHSGYWADPRVWKAINHVAAASQPTLDHYTQVRMLLVRLGNQAGVPVITLERALYLMSRAVQGKGMTWTEHGTALAAVIAAPSRTADNAGTSGDEQECLHQPPEAGRPVPHPTSPNTSLHVADPDPTRGDQDSAA
jgi:hypothetical protein